MNNFKSKDVLFYLGILCLSVWIVDFLNIVFFIHKPVSLLWYSNTGLLATAIALLRRDSKLVFILFCALFVVEGIWGIGFFSLLFFHKEIPGVADYAFQPSYSKKDFFISLYHFLIPISLLAAFIKLRKVHNYGWLGAAVYASVLTLLTLFFVNEKQDVNCVHVLTHCRSFLPFLYTFSNPLRLILGLTFITVFVFIPTDYILHQIGKRLKWETN